MSVQRLLRRHYGPSLPARLFALALKRQQGSKTLNEAIETATHRQRYFPGHVCFGVHRRLPSPSTYVAFFRNPVDRLISLYHFCHTSEVSFYHKWAKDVSLEEFLFDSEVFETDNGQVRLVAGSDESYFINQRPIGTCDRDLLEQAKSNIDRYFGFVGTVEKFDESILLLKEKLGWRSCYYLKRNVSGGGRKPPPDNGLRRRLEEKNALDMELYEYVAKRLEQDLDHLRPGLEKKVERFKRHNRTYSRLMLPVYDRYDALKGLASGNTKRPR